MYLHFNQPFRKKPHTFSKNYAWYWCVNIHSAEIFINLILQEEQLTSLDTIYCALAQFRSISGAFPILNIYIFLTSPSAEKTSTDKMQAPARHYQQLVNKETLLIFYIIRSMQLFYLRICNLWVCDMLLSQLLWLMQ